jgi:hypothetical protein
MKNRKIFYLISLILSSLLFFQCDDDSISSPSIENNLIPNPSFEENGDSSLANWFVNMPSLVHFTNDTPPNGGNWALTIDVLWGSGNDVISTVKIPEGTHIYKFSFWSKYSNNPGFAELVLVATDSVSQINRIHVDSETWGNYSTSDTITSVSGDSLQIKLSGGFSNLSPGKTYFDLCTLELLE